MDRLEMLFLIGKPVEKLMSLNHFWLDVCGRLDKVEVIFVSFVQHPLSYGNYKRKV
jgi:hypothetical protein